MKSLKKLTESIKKGNLSEGIIMYGVPENALNEIFQLDQFSKMQVQFHNENGIIIGNKLAESLNINVNEDIIIFNPKKLNSDIVFKAKIFTVESIFQTDTLESWLPLLFKKI